MFELNYRMIITDYDEGFFGGEGFLEIRCNANTYGEIYAPELNDVLFKDCIFDWFIRIIKACVLLNDNDIVYINDTDAYNFWIKFERISDANINVNLVEMKEWEGCHELETRNLEKCVEMWDNSLVDINNFRCEIIKKSREYLKELKTCNNEDCEEILEFERLLKQLSEIWKMQE